MSILVGELAGQVIGPGLVVLPGQGNTLAIETDAGVVVVDASSLGHAPGMIDKLRDHTDAPVHAIVYSHGHHGYNSSVADLAGAQRRSGETRRLDSWRMRTCSTGMARYRETRGAPSCGWPQCSSRRGKPVPLDALAPGFALHDPTETFADAITLVDGSRFVLS